MNIDLFNRFTLLIFFNLSLFKLDLAFENWRKTNFSQNLTLTPESPVITKETGTM